MEGDGSSKYVKIILFAVLVATALVVAVSTRSIFVSNTPEVWSNCVEQKEGPIYLFGETVSTREAASNVLAIAAGKNGTYAGNTIEPCGIGYIFNDSGEKYLICEDGGVYKYITVCKSEGIFKKGEDSLRALREANTSQLK